MGFCMMIYINVKFISCYNQLKDFSLFQKDLPDDSSILRSTQREYTDVLCLGFLCESRGETVVGAISDVALA